MRLIKIGRSASCDIVLHSNKVSNVHAEITILNNGDILLEDLDSHNGTYVMNKRIAPNTSINIKRGDAIRFADVELLWDQVPMPERSDNYKAIYGIGSNFRNEIQVVGHTVSRFHATLKISKNGKATIQDHSKNGTTINGTRINPNQNIALKRNDAVACGGVPVDIKRYIPASIMPKLIAIAGCIMLLIGAGFGIKELMGRINPPVEPTIQIEEYEDAVVLIVSSFHFNMVIENDPFKLLCKEHNLMHLYPEINLDRNANLSPDYIPTAPYTITGTGFFISKDGLIMTNKHVANPWVAEDAEDIQTQLNNIKTTLLSQLLPTSIYEAASVWNDGVNNYYYEPLIEYLIGTGQMSQRELIETIKTFHQCNCKFVGKVDRVTIGYSGKSYSNINQMSECVVVDVCDDYDLAILQLTGDNTTPRYIKHIVDLENYVDPKNLDTRENFNSIGYPSGFDLNYHNSTITPQFDRLTLGRKPQHDQIEFKGTVIGGASGSPVFDKNGRIIAVVFASYPGTNTGYAVRADHAYEFYKDVQKHR